MDLFAGKNNKNTKKESLIETCIIVIISGFIICLIYPLFDLNKG